MSSIKYALQNLLTKIVTAVLAFLTTLILPTWIGMEHFGMYSYLIVCIGFLIPLSSFGLGAGSIYLLSTRKYAIHQIGFTQLLLASIFGLINLMLLYVLNQMSWLGDWLQKANTFEWFCLMLSCFLQTLSFFIARLFFGISGFTVLNILELVYVLLNPILVGLFFYILGGQQTPYLFFAIAVFSIVSFMLHLYFLSRNPMEFRFHAAYTKESFNYGLKSWLGDVAIRANLRFDQMILGAIGPIKNLGLYNIAVKFSEIIWFIPDSLGPVLFNKLAVVESEESRLKLLFRIHRIIFWICFLIAILWSLVLVFLVFPFFFYQHASALIGLVMILLPGTLVLVSSKILTKLYSSSGHVIWTSYISIAGSLVSVILSISLIPRLSATGAAIASILAYFTMSCMANFILIKNFKFQWSEIISIRRSDFIWLLEQLKLLKISK
ncbi:MAG: polysaccharide biosynthesis C-terminal domain-containing protein [Saprospiraceae bacterium]|nr:polysaccharide biosynthesis C-terminal domain-containing protein [Saprospiraceae bacterium]